MKKILTLGLGCLMLAGGANCMVTNPTANPTNVPLVPNVMPNANQNQQPASNFAAYFAAIRALIDDMAAGIRSWLHDPNQCPQWARNFFLGGFLPALTLLATPKEWNPVTLAVLIGAHHFGHEALFNFVNNVNDQPNFSYRPANTADVFEKTSYWFSYWFPLAYLGLGRGLGLSGLLKDAAL